MKKLIFCLFGLLLFVNAQAQKSDTKVILITLDGLRWQELFSGADSLLVSNRTYVHDTTALKSRFWKPTPQERRKALMPFVWNTLSQKGQIHGNRNLGSKVDLTNKMWFSYPGYNEILTGKADDKRINSNDKIPNPNTTILEIVHSDKRYKNKVAAFGSWDVFPFIVNEERSGVPVNAGFEIAKGDQLSEREKFLNELQPKVPSPWGTVRLDAFTHYYAIEHMKKNHPQLTYIAYGETDDFAHDGNYEAYLTSAHNTDALLKNLYDFTQQDPFYKDKTLFIITTDHGRGTQPLETWKSHGDNIKGAGQVWMILFGKGVSAHGEISSPKQLYSNQIAPTVLKALDLKPEAPNMPGKVLSLNKD
ncbi:sulfatase-like hydrolase/transferase [Zobellia uliginosa]|uniref:sulfatase-like hydrolase/transferase n=1 Tax=Zobellia uliginosa TaxID=143224 RepID=UPI0026E22172|nr:sulfatase-like hydrolase/transferase [Zobellia uliginosa]MDO6516030.1 sulfatase-like hydrolase/transferase [Zobellia uliginosa]